jgi:type III secretion system YscI/HrpB-like protein
MALEAVRGVSAANPAMQPGVGAAEMAQPVADPSAVARFQAAMGTEGPSAASAIPFASEASAAWRSAQVNRQGLLHRIRALAEMQGAHSLSMAEMVELQYDVANLAFQQEVVTKVADKSSTAIQTLIKNQ